MNIIKLLLLVVFFQSCSFGEKELVFNKEIEYFDRDFISHFPKKVPIEYSQDVVSPNVRNSHPHVWLKFYIDETRLNKLKDSLNEVAIAKYRTDDSCLLVIDKHLTKTNWYKIVKTKRMPKKINYNYRPCHDNKYPVPNFYLSDWSETTKNPTQLDGYKLFLLDAKSGIHMDSTKLPNGLYTPKGWEHGYSKGIAINEKTNVVIFWADIW
ncbi:hypothetical protein [Marivirga sp.]|uniref:hypothetical protein n=1 Tax=Marivirga sp. TaxID=2018662 RepID=UPI003DA70AD1